VESGCSKLAGILFTIFISLVLCAAVWGQDLSVSGVPSNFNLDMKAAAGLRPKLMDQSVAASGPYATGGVVFERLVGQAPAASRVKFAWQLRIVEDEQLNAFSSPDGSVYVESGLARLAGSSAGLWAAIVSHEIAHVMQRDWARRYLYQKYLENGGGAGMVLGDPGLPTATSWSGSEKASADMGRFCRGLEVGADREGMMLMARGGYHPDFVPALHHLLHAHGLGSKTASIYAMHPRWEDRDHELSRAYVTASIEFARMWPEWYASPGGNPPVLVFAEEATVKKTGAKEWQVQIPMRCQNLAGAVEVVLHSGGRTPALQDLLPDQAESNSEKSQLTGCTSPKTTITFTFADSSAGRKPTAQWTDVYILDSLGGVLARADIPLHH
jgi:hypothetical protein